ncbi:MAG: hypothetical protein CV087_16915 [Candidatus Brocadia sp. WS118]|nr:MAG: hypothetical protein CV087_16915 [Candidatus Brocadia sp. WS118]
MNICFFLGKPVEPTKGGVQRITHVLGAELSSLKHSVVFLSINNSKSTVSGQKEKQFYLPDETVNSRENKNALVAFVKKFDIDIFVNQAGVYADVIDLVREVKNLKVQLITVHHNCIACLHKMYKDIVMSNRKDSFLWNILNPLPIWGVLSSLSRQKYRRLFLSAIEKSDIVVLYFQEFVEELASLTGNTFDASKVRTIANPSSFDADKTSLQHKKKQIVYVGRIVLTQKRIDRLLRVWHILHDKYLDYSFDIVGEGSYLTSVKEYLEKNSLHRIHVHGRQDPVPYLKHAQIFTLTSDFEGYGMVLMEAQAFGAIPISFRCFSAIDEVILHNKTGFIIDNFDEDHYLRAVNYLIAEESVRNKMMQDGLEHVNKFNVKDITYQWIQLFSELSSGN